MGRFAIFISVVALSTLARGRAPPDQSTTTSVFADIRLMCVLDKSCDGKDTCELPCKVKGSKGQGQGQGQQVITTSSFIDEEFEELWDEMQEKMKNLNDHQTELLAQQHDLLKEQQRFEFENRQLKKQQSELLERQEILEQENERLRTLETGEEQDEDTKKRIQDLEIQIRVLTEQQRKLSSQQSRLVEQQNRLLQRQRKLEQQNVNLMKRQERIESLNLGSTRPGDLIDPAELDGDVVQPTPEVKEPKVIDPMIESKLDTIKKEMEHRIEQLTGQQEELLREQTRLIGRQIRLEEENQDLRDKQEQLEDKQKALERENRELKANLTYRVTDPEHRRRRIEAEGLCQVMHADMCFGLLGDGSDELTRDVAQDNCRKYGGDLANIYDKEHYEIIKRHFLKNNITSGVWLGMKYNPQNFKVTMIDGKDAPYIKWNFIYPLKFSSYTAMYLYFDKDPKSIYSGMVNLPPTWRYPYALCQFGMQVLEQ